MAPVNKLIEVFSLRLAKLFKGEVINDKQVRLRVAAQLLLPGIISPAASRVRQKPVSLGERALCSPGGRLDALKPRPDESCRHPRDAEDY